jgi:diaminopimelate epimerase
MNTDNKPVSLPFIKLSGAGNDFVLFDEAWLEKSSVEYGELARKVCNRRLGIGADGILIYKTHDSLPFEMLYFNSDGSTGGMCGNGARCIAAYYFSTYGKNEKEVHFTAFHNIYTATIDGEYITVQMIDPSHLISNLTLNIDGNTLACHFIHTGSPHVVVFLNDMKKLYPDLEFELFDLQYLGKQIRKHEAFKPLGANVNFIKPNTDGTISMRTYERGVEEETLACGTGAIASGVLTNLELGYQPPVTVHTRSGDTLTVNFSRGEKKNSVTAVTLTGSWLYHFKGIVYIDKENQYTGSNYLSEHTIEQLLKLTYRQER